jgi:hypothetical protein
MTNQEQFEAWHRSVVAGDPPHEKYNSGDYRNQHVQRYWFGWRASREALSVDMPKPLPSGDYRMTVPFYKAADIIEALSAAGIEVKA